MGGEEGVGCHLGGLTDLLPSLPLKSACSTPSTEPSPCCLLASLRQPLSTFEQPGGDPPLLGLHAPERPSWS